MNIKAALLEYLRKRGLRKKSHSTYESKIKIFCEYLGKRRIYRPQRITRHIAEAFLDTVSKSPTTRNNYRDTLRTFFNDFLKDKLILLNPFAGITKRREARQGKMFFTDDQAVQLAAIIERENPVLWMGCKMLYYCFIRNNELAQMPTCDVHAADSVLRVHASYAKNGKTQTVVIPDQFVDDVRDWYKMQIENEDERFLTVKGSAIARGDWFSRQHNAILRKYGYSTRYSFYSWKHTGAVHFYRATKDLKALQVQLRHHSLDQVDEYLRELGVMENIGIKIHCMPTKKVLHLAA